MKKTFGIILAVVIAGLGAIVAYGIKSAMDKAAKDAAERAAANAEADAAEKLAAHCSELRRETRELKRRTAKLEELIASKRDNPLTPDGERHRHDNNIDIGETWLRKLQTRDASEFNWRTNVIASWGAARIRNMHANVMRRLELLDSIGASTMTTLDAATHEYYRELFALEAQLRELLVVKEFKDRTVNTDDDGINEAHAEAKADLPEIRAKMHAAYGRERELLLTKIVKSIGMSEERQTNAVQSIRRIIDATTEVSLLDQLQSFENVGTNSPALPEQKLQLAMHQIYTNSLAAIDAIDTSKMNANDANIHQHYRQSVIKRNEYNELYLTTRIDALLKRAGTTTVAQALNNVEKRLDDILRELRRDERWFIDLKGKERNMLLTKAAESLDLGGADIDYFVTTVIDLIAALGTPPM